jgi:hypothetical protein
MATPNATVTQAPASMPVHMKLKGSVRMPVPTAALRSVNVEDRTVPVPALDEDIAGRGLELATWTHNSNCVADWQKRFGRFWITIFAAEPVVKTRFAHGQFKYPMNLEFAQFQTQFQISNFQVARLTMANGT